ncbi:MAG: hypothetical protein Q8L35_01855 [Actinomycetota bacterium]|nr:hypothetical protein [Actinomycetota bacterium]
MALFSAPAAGDFVVEVGIGAAMAGGNFLLSLLTAKFASTRTIGTAMGLTVLGMAVRLAGVAGLFLMLLKLGYKPVPLLISFVFLYTMFMGVEAVLLNRERG